jgi:hypothetical protein
MAGLVPAVTVKNTRPCHLYPDARHKAGHDESVKLHRMLLRIAAGIEALFVEGREARSPSWPGLSRLSRVEVRGGASSVGMAGTSPAMTDCEGAWR